MNNGTYLRQLYPGPSALGDLCLHRVSREAVVFVMRREREQVDGGGRDTTVDSCAESAASSTTDDMSDEPSDQSDTMQNPPVSKAAAQRQGRYVGKQSSLESVQSRIWSQHRHVCFSIDSSAHEAMLGGNWERRHCSATPREMLVRRSCC